MLLLDEPLSALDAKVRVQLRDEIRRLQLEIGTTTLFVTHDQEEALAVADRVGVMNQGRLEQLAAPADLYANPATPFVAEFVGLNNKVPAQVSGGQAQLLGAAVPTLPGSITSGAGLAMVRPEAVTVTADPGHVDRQLRRVPRADLAGVRRHAGRRGLERPGRRCGGAGIRARRSGDRRRGTGRRARSCQTAVLADKPRSRASRSAVVSRRIS